MNYELVYILTPKLTDQEAKDKAAAITALIKKEADKIIMEDFWGKRELAYPIKGYNNGHYVAVQFSIADGDVNKIDKGLKLTEEVIRFLLIKKEKITVNQKKSRPVKDAVAAVPVETGVNKKDVAVINERSSVSQKKADLNDLDKKLDDILNQEIKD